MDEGSVTRLIADLKGGNKDAVGALWQRFYPALVRIAEARLHAALRRAIDGEDIVTQAVLELCDCLAREDAAERFPRLHNREQLWRLLVCFTARAAFDHNQKAARRAAVVAGESALGEEGFAALAGREPPPEFAAAVGDLLEKLPDDGLRQVALWKLEGCTNEEIARRLGRAVTTVEVKLKAIRALWKAAAQPE
jgi:DNA-directed RNA polymerase specialized sigma24 family protein